MAGNDLFQAKPYNVSVTLALPPDTDTPGFANEEKSKPPETRLISESGGLMSPEVVGTQLIKDALVNFSGKIMIKESFFSLKCKTLQFGYY